MANKDIILKDGSDKVFPVTKVGNLINEDGSQAAVNAVKIYNYKVYSPHAAYYTDLVIRCKENDELTSLMNSYVTCHTAYTYVYTDLDYIVTPWGGTTSGSWPLIKILNVNKEKIYYLFRAFSNNPYNHDAVSDTKNFIKISNATELTIYSYLSNYVMKNASISDTRFRLRIETDGNIELVDEAVAKEDYLC